MVTIIIRSKVKVIVKKDETRNEEKKEGEVLDDGDEHCVNQEQIECD